MNVKICPSCGCSLVRLGIAEVQAVQLDHAGSTYFFCCQGCADIFQEQPDHFVEEVKDIHVCPSCLAEKPSAYTVPVAHNGQELRFCRCPHCAEVFAKDPDFYLDRLTGKTEFKGLFSESGAACC